jgi:hypothetical protein
MATSVKAWWAAPLVSCHLNRILLQTANESLHQSILDQPPVEHHMISTTLFSTLLHVDED